MKTPTKRKRSKIAAVQSVSEILILADGKILAHNISPLMAGLLAELNPGDAAMNQRALREKL